MASWVSAIGSVLTNTQLRDVVLRRSTWYPTMGVPPSDGGGAHDSLSDVASTSEAVGGAG